MSSGFLFIISFKVFPHGNFVTFTEKIYNPSKHKDKIQCSFSPSQVVLENVLNSGDNYAEPEFIRKLDITGILAGSTPASSELLLCSALPQILLDKLKEILKEVDSMNPNSGTIFCRLPVELSYSQKNSWLAFSIFTRMCLGI